MNNRWGALALGLLVLPVVGAAQDRAVMGAWSPVVDWPLSAVHTHLLPTGKVMFSSEFADGAKMYSWDPSSDVLTRLPDAPYNIFCAGHAYLPDGRLLLAGGHISDDHGLADASLFDPWSQQLIRLPDMNAGRWYPTVTGLENGDLVVVAGAAENGTSNAIPQVWEHAINRWRDLTGARQSLPYYPWMFLAPGGRVFMAGPFSLGQWLDTSGTGRWINGPRTRSGTNRSYGSAVSYQPGKLLITGGGSPPTNSSETLDLSVASPNWTQTAPMRFVRRQHNATLLPDGAVLVTGGHSGSPLDDPTRPVFATERWNPATGTWTTLAPASAYRGYHSVGLLLPDGRVLSASSRSQTDMQVFSPPYLFQGARPVLSSSPDGVGYGAAFTVATPDPSLVARVTWVRLGSVTHSFNENQRFAELTFTRGSGLLNLTAPARPDLVPPGHYLMFLLNAQGVPSVARVIRLGGDAAPPPPPPPPPEGPEQLVIPFGSQWRFHDGNQDLGSGWTAMDYDDSSWKLGRAQLGYGDGDEKTQVLATSPRQPSIYFRHSLQLDAAPTLARLKVLKDDGVSVWVNGVQVYAHRVNSTAFSALATASSADNELTEVTLPPERFMAGHNVVAVMIKQSSTSSSDLSFDLALTLDVGTTPHVGFLVLSPNGGEQLRAGTTGSVSWMGHGETAESVRLEYSTDLGTSWTPIDEMAPNTGSYSWTVPAVETTRALFRVSDGMMGGGMSDVSDGPFTVTSSETWRAIPFGAYWKFEDSGANPGASWNTSSFDDTAWRGGAGELGYGDGDERTLLTRTSPSQPSVYFRHPVEVPDTVGAASVTVRYDDGFALYVNGALALSRNLAGTAHGDWATTSSEDNSLATATLDPRLFVRGTNLVTVVVKQAGGSSSDLSFDAELTLSTGSGAPPPIGPRKVVAITRGAAWRFLDQGPDQGTAWIAPGFNDSAWDLGNAELGYGDDDEATLLGRNRPSVYLRHQFNAAAAPTGATVTVRYDDGFAIWVNGTQVASRNVGSTAYSSYATAAAENQEVTLTLPAGAFVAGTNTVAVIVKQVSSTSSDLSFDLSLEVDLP